MLCELEVAVGIFGCLFCWKKGIIKKWKCILLVLLLSGMLGMLLDFKESREAENADWIERNAPGGGALSEDFVVEVPELETEKAYSLEIQEKKLSEEEQDLLFADAAKEAEERFLGDNASLDEIEEPVKLPEHLSDGLVEAEWSFDNYEIMNPDGTIKQDGIPEDGALVKAEVVMTYCDISQSHEFCFLVKRRELSGEEKLWQQLGSYVEELKQAGEEKITLPNELAGYALVWKKKKSGDGELFALLGTVAAVALLFRGKEDEYKKRIAWEKEMLLYYPEMITKLTLLLGAGMPMTAAFKKIALSYQKQREHKKIEEIAVYEQMLITCYEMQDGMGEREAYLRFADRCYLQPYRRFISFLTQNLRKGQRELTTLLEQEAEEAFVIRKNLAKKAGEEAGTKLLFPMMMMLMLVMGIILIPACMSFQL